VSTLKAKFPGKCRKCGERFPAGEAILWDRTTSATSHVVCPPVQPKPEAPKLNLASIAEFIGRAKAFLKFPKVRFLAPDGKSELRLGITGPDSRVPGSVAVKVNDTYRGLVRPDGTVVGDLTDLVPSLLAVAADPVSAAKAYAQLYGQCSFCGLTLTDAGSVEVGYGPICAKHYGLPHQPKGTPSIGIAPVEGRSSLQVVAQ
jgi:hypothetical protein